MRKTSSFIFLIPAILSIIFFNACHKSTASGLSSSVRKLIAKDPQYSIFDSAVSRENLGNALDSANVTLFAPDNDAFAASGITINMIASMPDSLLKKLIKYHIVFPAIDSVALPVSDSVSSFQGKLLFLSHNANGLFVNGIKIKIDDVIASNGVIQVMSQVLMPPSQSLNNTIAADTTLTFFAAAVKKAALWVALSNPAKFTVFAPTNTAFRNAGFASTAQINSTADTTIARIVGYHIISTNVFTSDFTNGGVIDNLQGSTLTEGLSGTVLLTGTANPASNIITPNILTTNGVMHKIDRVLE